MQNYNLSEPVFLRNLVIFPIKSKDGQSGDNGVNPLTIEEIINSKKGGFRELDMPDVNEIIFENHGDDPVMMLDGEEITGSLQNRIIAVSNLVEAKSSKNLPVICAEEKRWDEIGGFRTGYCSYPRIRSILAKGLYEKTDTQQIVWDEIERKLSVTKTVSQTSSMHEIYNNLRDEVLSYVEDFENLNHNTVGFIGVAGNQIFGCDIFLSPKIYHKFEDKLIRSYALDAIEYQRIKGKQPKVNEFFDSIMEQIPSSTSKTRSRNTRIRGKNFLGQALVYQNRILHLSAFPVLSRSASACLSISVSHRVFDTRWSLKTRC